MSEAPVIWRRETFIFDTLGVLAPPRYVSRFMKSWRTFPILLLAAAAFGAGTPSQTTVFKSVGPDGRTLYGDRPPADGSLSSSLKIVVPPSSPLSAETLAYVEHLKQAGTTTDTPLPNGQIALFTTTWCGFCKKAKAYLASNGLPFKEIDVESPAGAASYARAGGTRGVPLLVLNGRHVLGFSPSAYDALLSVRN